MGRRRRDHRGRPIAALSRAAKADTTAYVEPSARASTVEWTPDAIRAAELYADAGNLRQAADLCDAVLADDQVQGALTTLVGALMGLDLEFEASGDKRRSNRAIKALEVEEDWWKAFPEPELNLLLTWAVLLGVALAEIVWTEDPETGRVPGALRVWHPRHLRWDGRTRKWMLRVDDDGREIEIVPGDGRWILLAPKGARRPWKNGAWRAIARWWLLKDYAIRDWGGYSERHGTGTLVAETGPNVPSGSTKEKREKLARQLNALGRNSAIAMPPGWTIKLVEATANTAATFERQIGLADRGMTIALHGTNLTNEDGGSYAKALVLGGVHIQVIKSLAEALSTTLHEQHLVFWAEYNFGDRRLAPWPLWPVEPPADLKGKADALGSVAIACTSLKALSDRVDIDAILEEHGVPLLKNAPMPKPKAPPDTEDPVDEDAAEAEVEAAPPARHARPLRLARARAPGFVAGQVYTDTLADEARDVGARTLGPDLRVIAEVIEGARDYESLRDALKAAYRGMSPRALAGVVEKAILLGELGGRLSAIKDQ